MNRVWQALCFILGIAAGHIFTTDSRVNTVPSCIFSPSSNSISHSQQKMLGLRPATLPTDTLAFHSGKNGVWEKVTIGADSVVLVDKQGRVRYMSGSGDRFETERDIRYVSPGNWVGYPENNERMLTGIVQIVNNESTRKVKPLPKEYLRMEHPTEPPAFGPPNIPE